MATTTENIYCKCNQINHDKNAYIFYSNRIQVSKENILSFLLALGKISIMNNRINAEKRTTQNIIKPEPIPTDRKSVV